MVSGVQHGDSSELGLSPFETIPGLHSEIDGESLDLSFALLAVRHAVAAESASNEYYELVEESDEERDRLEKKLNQLESDYAGIMNPVRRAAERHHDAARQLAQAVRLDQLPTELAIRTALRASEGGLREAEIEGQFAPELDDIGELVQELRGETVVLVDGFSVKVVSFSGDAALSVKPDGFVALEKYEVLSNVHTKGVELRDNGLIFGGVTIGMSNIPYIAKPLERFDQNVDTASFEEKMNNAVTMVVAPDDVLELISAHTRWTEEMTKDQELDKVYAPPIGLAQFMNALSTRPEFASITQTVEFRKLWGTSIHSYLTNQVYGYTLDPERPMTKRGSSRLAGRLVQDIQGDEAFMKNLRAATSSMPVDLLESIQEDPFVHFFPRPGNKLPRRMRLEKDAHTTAWKEIIQGLIDSK